MHLRCCSPHQAPSLSMPSLPPSNFRFMVINEQSRHVTCLPHSKNRVKRMFLAFTSSKPHIFVWLWSFAGNVAPAFYVTLGFKKPPFFCRLICTLPLFSRCPQKPAISVSQVFSSFPPHTIAIDDHGGGTKDTLDSSLHSVPPFQSLNCCET